MLFIIKPTSVQAFSFDFKNIKKNIVYKIESVSIIVLLYIFEIDNIKFIQVNNFIKKINPYLNNIRVNYLSVYYIKASEKHDIDIRHLLAVGSIETKFKSKQSFKGNHGVQQINWTAHKNNLIKNYNINSSKELIYNDYVNIDYSAKLIKSICFDSCSLKQLTIKYNGRDNKKYEQELRSNLVLFDSL
jgi:hypothetical protein